MDNQNLKFASDVMHITSFLETLLNDIKGFDFIWLHLCCRGKGVTLQINKATTAPFIWAVADIAFFRQFYRKRITMSSHPAWLIDEKRPLSKSGEKQLARELSSMGPGTRGGTLMPRLAISLHDIIVLDNRKWFGGANIRVDALVVTGYENAHESDSYYIPKTASFPRVADGDRLPIGDGGLLIFHGLAEHFVDLSIMVSRDRKDSDSLAGLLKKVLSSNATAGIISGLSALAGGPPEVNLDMVKSAMQGATALGDLAYQVLRQATGGTIGLYRNTHLRSRDGFGIGVHPGPGNANYKVNDLTFRYEINEE